jgi:hypothetical protein
MTMKKCLLILLLFATGSIFAQSKRAIHDYSVIDLAEWIIPKTDTLDYTQAEFAGQHALLLKRKFENYKSASVAYPKGLKFKNGIIELDIASPAGKAGYVGLAFRIRDQHHYETLYFRPGSSGTINAVQYMPEKKLEFNWWDYEAEKYQAKTSLPVDGWFHVKVVVKGSQFTLFINYDPKPVFGYNALDPSLESGSVGFWLGNCRSGAYRNLKVISQP